MDSMEPPKKKIKPNSHFSIESLPDDIIITILAKVPISNYPFLSLVSKKFRSFTYSKDLFSIRSSYGTTEITVFVSLKLPTNENICWYNLVKSPKKSKHLLVPLNYSYNKVHSTDSPAFRRKNLSRLQEIALGMSLAWKNGVLHRFGEKLYVMGSCNDSKTTNWAQVFDRKTQTWKSFKSLPPDVLRGYKIYKIRVYGNKVYVWTDTKDYSYDLKIDKWEVLEERLSKSKSWCYVNKVLYHVDHRNGFKWYDGELKIWRNLKGLSRLKNEYGILKSGNMIEIIEYDKKLLVFFDKFEERDDNNKKIWCVEILLKKRNGAMKGKIKWIDEVLTVPSSYNFVSCVSTWV